VALLARAQELAMPVAGFIRDGSAEANARNVIAFRKGLNETGYVEGQNVKYFSHIAIRIACPLPVKADPEGTPLLTQCRPPPH
jgi:hypothetical protein